MNLGQRLALWWRPAPRTLPDSLWQSTLAAYGFLAALTSDEQKSLRALSSGFLAEKEFQGAGGLEITDQIALSIAAQACLPLLRLKSGPDRRALGNRTPLIWYRDFVGVVVQPCDVVARREVTDDDGVVHVYDEVLVGEAMEHGPVMLSWQAVQESGASTDAGFNVVVHEFAHKLDMADGVPDGCPPLPAGFMGTQSAHAARQVWREVWEEAYAQFCDAVIVAERFGGAPPWLDSYGTQNMEEFFAVACEAYFVNPQRFSDDCAMLRPLLDAFFQPG